MAVAISGQYDNLLFDDGGHTFDIEKVVNQFIESKMVNILQENNFRIFDVMQKQNQRITTIESKLKR